METVLGLFGVVLFIVGVVSLAAAVTFVVVKVTPSKAVKEQKQAEAEGS